MRILLGLLLSLYLPHTLAFDLFGVNVMETGRDQIRDAIRTSGAVVIREAGEGNWFDIYDMSRVFKQSKKMFVAYDKNSGQFAFAEYQLPYDYVDTMLSRLTLKYGKPELKNGMFHSDTQYHWTIDGVAIALYRNWQANFGTLMYSAPDVLVKLQQDYTQSRRDELNKTLQNETSYY